MFANSLSVLGQNITKQAEAKQETGDRLMSRNMLHIIAFRDTDQSLSRGAWLSQYEPLLNLRNSEKNTFILKKQFISNFKRLKYEN